MMQTILLVEDDPTSRYMMQEVIEELGLACQIAHDGQECLDILAREPAAFDLILMDIHMPRKTGTEALEAIRASESDPPRGIKVVAVSADNAWHDEARARDAGFDAVLPKPVNIKAVSALVAA